MKVRWMPKTSIARMAEDVISGYETTTGKRVAPPIPVENIIEFGLNLGLAFEDLRCKLNMDDVLGATYVESRKICADISCFFAALAFDQLEHYAPIGELQLEEVQEGTFFCAF
jgi:hypothetical protein